MTFLENTFLVVSFVCLLNFLFVYPENYHIRGYYNFGFVNGIFFILVFFLTNEHYNNSKGKVAAGGKASTTPVAASPNAPAAVAATGGAVPSAPPAEAKVVPAAAGTKPLSAVAVPFSPLAAGASSNNSVVNVQQSKNQIYRLTIKRGVQTPSYDIFYTFIIVASSENKARQIAQQKSYGDETKFIDDSYPHSRSIEKRIDFWTDSKKTDCVLVNTDKEDKVCGCFING